MIGLALLTSSQENFHPSIISPPGHTIFPPQKLFLSTHLLSAFIVFISFNLCFGLCFLRTEEQSAGPSSGTATKRRIMTEVRRRCKQKSEARSSVQQNRDITALEDFLRSITKHVTVILSLQLCRCPLEVYLRHWGGTSSAGDCSGSSKLTGHPDPVYVATCCNLILHLPFISLHLGKELFAKVETDVSYQLLRPILPQFSSAAPAPADRLHSDSCCIFK